jgi:Tfp pilus assembly protein PilF
MGEPLLLLYGIKWFNFGVNMASDRIEKLKAFLQQAPNDCFLHHALALEYVKAGSDGDARKEFEVNLAFDPSYVATYYHLAKLLERIGARERAITIYEQGMVKAKEAKDMHSYNELQAAYEDLVY